MNPADALLPLAEASKEASLDVWGKWLVITTGIVIVGLIIEYTPEFIERLDKSKWKSWFVMLGAIGVVLGVAGEGITEFKALRTEGQLRSIVHEEDGVRAIAVADANQRAAQALKNATEDEKLFAPRKIGYEDSPRGKALKDFCGTQVLIQCVPEFEAEKLASELGGLLAAVGWRYEYVNQADTGVSPFLMWDGVQIVARRPMPYLAGLKMPVPPPDPAVGKTFAAATALGKYLGHFDVGNTVNGGVFTNAPLKFALPTGTICVLIGAQPIVEQIEHRHQLEQLPEKVRAWQESIEKQLKEEQ